MTKYVDRTIGGAEYRIGDNGIIYGAEGGVLSQRVGKGGYLLVTLGLKDERVQRLVHRVIAETFIPNIENKPEVNHIDSDRRNNSVSNLEWVTKSENMRHAFAYGKKTQKGEKNATAKLNDSIVKQILKEYSTGDVSQKEFAERYGVCKATIHNIINRKSWVHIIDDPILNIQNVGE